MTAEDIVTLALEDFDTAKNGWQETFLKARDDLHFLSDELFAQWDEQEALSRSAIGRPVYTVDQLSQFIHQVTNEIRMNTPTIKVIPEGGGADIETAEIYEGRIKGIEYRSNADVAYDTAADFSVKSSIGFIRVDHDYVDDTGFEQEMKIVRVINPQSIYIDPASIEPDGSDAMYGFVLEEMTVKEFNKLYPDKTASSFGDVKPVRDQKLTDKITLAEYFKIEEDSQEFGLTEDGDIQKKTEDGVYKSVRKAKKRKVMRYKLSGQDVLEKTTFPGRYIPLVPVYGEEAWIEGKRNLYSLIRKSKQAQMLYNLWKSLETELLLKQQQAPVQAAAGQMDGFEEDWKDPAKASVLYYHQTDITGKDAPPPQRLAQPQIPTGIVNAARETVDDIKATMGLYNASIGQKSNEISGVAIQRRQQEGDVATFHFGDNLVRSIAHVGKIIVFATPDILDTPREIKVVNPEGETKVVGINGLRVPGQEKTFYLNKGKWDVRVITGAPFTTQRQEAAAFGLELLKSVPESAPMIMDLVAKYQDGAGAQAIAARLKKAVDPKFLEEDEREGQEDPRILELQGQLQQLTTQAQQQIAALEGELKNKQADTEVKMADVQLKAQELELKKGDQQLKAVEIQTKAELEAKKLEIEQSKVEIEAYNAQKETPEPVKQQVEPMGIKLDTTGFQMMKTPEQLALDEQEVVSKQTAMEQDLQTRMNMLEGIGGIQQLLSALVQQTGIQTQAIVQQTEVMAKPIDVIRDENGLITGAV